MLCLQCKVTAVFSFYSFFYYFAFNLVLVSKVKFLIFKKKIFKHNNVITVYTGCFLCVFSRLLDTHEQFCTFSGCDGERLLPLSKASKTHPKISNTLHLHVVTVHIHHNI